MAPDWRTGDAPSGWSSRRLVEAVAFPKGQVDPRMEPYSSMTLVAPDHIDSGTGRLLARVSAAQQGAISGKYLFQPGDVVYSKIRPYLRKVVRADFPGLSSADMYPLRAEEGLDSHFLLHLLLGEHFSRFAEIVSMRSGFPKINRTEFGEYVAALPPLPEQRRIAEVLDTVDEAIRKTEEIIAKLKQVKQGLLHDLLTRGIDDNGELRDPDRHPEQFKDSPLGRIPKAWEVERLGALLDSIDGGWSPACIEQPPSIGQWGVLKVSAVSGGVFRAHESKTLPSDLAPRPELEVKRGDVVLTRANGVAELVGVTAQAGEVPPCLMLSDKLLRLRPGSRLSRDFLATVMSSWLVRRQIARLMSGSSGQKNISQAQIRSFLVPLPSLAEQAECVARLQSVEERRSGEEASLAKLRSAKNGLMDDLLTGRVRVTPLLDEAAE